MSDQGERGESWTLLTGHGHVLVEISRHPEARIRDISAVVGLTERTVQAIVADLEAAGYLSRARSGRRTQYTVNPESLFRHPAQDGHRVGPFLALLAATGDGVVDTPGWTEALFNQPPDADEGDPAGRRRGRPRRMTSRPTLGQAD